MATKNRLDQNLNFEITDAAKKKIAAKRYDLMAAVEVAQNKFKTETTTNRSNTIIINKSPATKYTQNLIHQKGLKFNKGSKLSSYRTFYLNAPQLKKLDLYKKKNFNISKLIRQFIDDLPSDI